MNVYDLMCEFIKTENFRYKCRLCGTVAMSFDPLEYPSIICATKIKMYPPEQHGIIFKPIDPQMDPSNQIKTDQAIDEIKKCSTEQIEERFSICSGCEFYKESTCEKCGCHTVRDQIYMNKLAWKDQECPIGKWKRLI
jgi:hypothetical protein